MYEVPEEFNEYKWISISGGKRRLHRTLGYARVPCAYGANAEQQPYTGGKVFEITDHGVVLVLTIQYQTHCATCSDPLQRYRSYAQDMSVPADQRVYDCKDCHNARI